MPVAIMPNSVRSSTVSELGGFPALVPTGRHDTRPPFYLDRPVTLIGSRHRAHIRLESDEVSRSHAIVVNTGGRVVVRDLGSRTHVYVNGQEVQEAVLRDGDHVNIGRFALRFAAGDAPDLAESGQVHGAPGAAMLTGDRLDPAGVALNGPLCVVGSREGVDLLLKGKDVSFAHAVIVHDGGRHVLRDLGSRTGTFLDGVAVEGDAELRPGSVVRIGAYRMRYSPVVTPLATPTEPDLAVSAADLDLAPAAKTWFPPENKPLVEPTVQPQPKPESKAESKPPPAARPKAPRPKAKPEVAAVPMPAAEPFVERPAPQVAPAELPATPAIAPTEKDQTAAHMTPITPPAAVPPPPISSPAVIAAMPPIVPTAIPTLINGTVVMPDRVDEVAGPAVELPREGGTMADLTAEADFAYGPNEPEDLTETVGTAAESAPVEFAQAAIAPTDATVSRTAATEAVAFEDGSAKFESFESVPPASMLAGDVPPEAGGTPAVPPVGSPLATTQPLQAAPIAAPPPLSAALSEVPPTSSPATVERTSQSDILSEGQGLRSAPSPGADADPFDEIGAVLDAFLGFDPVPAIADEPDLSAPGTDAAHPVETSVGETVIEPAPAAAKAIAPAHASTAQRHTWSPRSDPTPPSTWGVLAAAVAMADQPPADEPLVPWSDAGSPPARARRSWLKWCILAGLLLSAAGFAYVLLNTDAYTALRRHF